MGLWSCMYCVCRHRENKGHWFVSQAKRTVCAETQDTKAAVLSVKRNVLFVKKHRTQRPQFCQLSEMYCMCRNMENKGRRSVSQAKCTICAEP